MTDIRLPGSRAADAKLSDEPGRLAALRRYGVLDTPVEEPFDKLTSLVRAIMQAPICAVSLVDAERQWFKSSEGLDLTETPRCDAFCSQTIMDREPMIITDARDDPRFRDNRFVRGAPHIVSYAGVPLRTPDGYNVGALCVIDTVPRTFDATQVEILKSFAALVIDELELRQIAQRDVLTGLMTRRALVEEAERHIDEHRRSRRASTLVMFDVDHFKSVNDRFGHPAGDLVLQEVARRASTQLRSNDRLGRVGGEEFAFLMPGTGTQAAMLVAERVRVALAARPVALDPPLLVTASFGIAPLTDEMTTAALWLAAADAPLYRAKRTGRNRCIMAASPSLTAMRCSA